MSEQTSVAVLGGLRERLDGIDRYAQSKAISARARGDNEEERRWLDLLINLDAARAIGDQLAAALDAATTERALACPNCGPGECACGLLAEMQRERASTTGGDKPEPTDEEAVKALAPWRCCLHCAEDDQHTDDLINAHEVPCQDCLLDRLATRSVPASGAGEDGLRAGLASICDEPDDRQEWEHEDGRSVRYVDVVDVARLRRLIDPHAGADS